MPSPWKDREAARALGYSSPYAYRVAMGARRGLTPGQAAGHPPKRPPADEQRKSVTQLRAEGVSIPTPRQLPSRRSPPPEPEPTPPSEGPSGPQPPREERPGWGERTPRPPDTPRNNPFGGERTHSPVGAWGGFSTYADAQAFVDGDPELSALGERYVRIYGSNAGGWHIAIRDGRQRSRRHQRI